MSHKTLARTTAFDRTHQDIAPLIAGCVDDSPIRGVRRRARCHPFIPTAAVVRRPVGRNG